MTRNEILRNLQENRKIIIGHGVKRMGIFGSYARDEQTPGSDIDLLVELDQVTLKEYLDLKEFLERLLEHRVDLVSFRHVEAEVEARCLERGYLCQGTIGYSWMAHRKQQRRY